MDLKIVDRRGVALTPAQLLEHAAQRGELRASRRQDPARVLENLQQRALAAWHGRGECPPELFWVDDRKQFVDQFIALHI